jgi:hypothetical protein
VRWQILSHFSGDPGASYKGPPLPGWAPGKLIAIGDLEVGVKEYPWRAFLHPFTAAEFEKDLADGAEYLDMPTARWHWKDDSPPFLFRVLPMTWGTLGHLGLDFWRGVQGAPRNTSFFTDSNSLTVPGPDGARPTVRFQMLREGVQDMEIRLTMVRAARDLPEDRRKAVHEVLDEFTRRATWGTPYLSQCELSYDWRSYAAGVQEAAAELAGVKAVARWSAPPEDGGPPADAAAARPAASGPKGTRPDGGSVAGAAASGKEPADRRAVLARLVAAVKAGARPSFRLSSTRATMTVTSAKPDGALKLSARGTEMTYDFSRLTDGDVKALAEALGN